MTASTIALKPEPILERLRFHGVEASLNADLTEVQVYINNGNGALLVGADGNIAEVHWDRTGGVLADKEVATVTTEEQAVHAVRQWHYQYRLRCLAESLLDYLQEEVPPSGMNIVIEDAKSALRSLGRFAENIDFMHGREA